MGKQSKRKHNRLTQPVWAKEVIAEANKNQQGSIFIDPFDEKGFKEAVKGFLIDRANDCNTDSQEVNSKTFKEQTSDYIDALSQFLEKENIDVDAHAVVNLEIALYALIEAVDYLLPSKPIPDEIIKQFHRLETQQEIDALLDSQYLESTLGD